MKKTSKHWLWSHKTLISSVCVFGKHNLPAGKNIDNWQRKASCFRSLKYLSPCAIFVSNRWQWPLMEQAILNKPTGNRSTIQVVGSLHWRWTEFSVLWRTYSRCDMINHGVGAPGAIRFKRYSMEQRQLESKSTSVRNAVRMVPSTWFATLVNDLKTSNQCLYT